MRERQSTEVNLVKSEVLSITCVSCFHAWLLVQLWQWTVFHLQVLQGALWVFLSSSSKTADPRILKNDNHFSFTLAQFKDCCPSLAYCAEIDMFLILLTMRIYIAFRKSLSPADCFNNLWLCHKPTKNLVA